MIKHGYANVEQADTSTETKAHVDNRIHKGAFVGALATAAMGAAMLALALTSDDEMMLSSLIFLGLCAFLTFQCVKCAHGGKRVLAVGVVLLAGLGGASPFVLTDVEESRQRDIANELLKLVEFRGRSPESGALPFHDKLLVWDCTSDRPSPVQHKLPIGQRANSDDAKITVVLVISHDDDAVTEYDSGEPGYQRTLKVGVINWPEKEVLGIFTIKGSHPGIVEFRKKGDTSRIVGETDKRLLEWIERGEGRND